jgi:hypothetical protein
MIRLVLVLLGIGIVVTALNWGKFGDRGIVVFFIPWALVAGGYAMLILVAWLLRQPVTGSVFRSTRAIRWMTLAYFLLVYVVGASVWRAYRHGVNIPSRTAVIAGQTVVVGLEVFIGLLVFWGAMSIGKASQAKASKRST